MKPATKLTRDRTIFLYPLSSFFVLFCNIIGELDSDDYTLIQEIVQCLTPFAASPYVSKLLRLLESLQNFCTPLIEAKQRLGPKTKVAPWYPSATGTIPESTATLDPNFAVDNSSGTSFVGNISSHQAPAIDPQTYPPTDELMWHLFNSQLSMEFFDSDYLSLDPNSTY